MVRLHELPFWSAAWETFLLMSIAEVFDKTFFVVLVLAIRYNKFAVWAGGSAALLAHTFLAAFGGVLINAGLQKAYIDMFAAGLYLVFAMVYFWELRQLPEDAVVSERIEEVADLETVLDPTSESGGPDAPAAVKAQDEASPLVPRSAHTPSWWLVCWTAFAATFVAEIGDRTQVALISQHAAQPLWAVVIGSSVAFVQLNTIAVVVGDLVQRQGLKERTVVLTAAVSFVVFALITLQDAVFELKHPELKLGAGESFKYLFRGV